MGLGTGLSGGFIFDRGIIVYNMVQKAKDVTMKLIDVDICKVVHFLSYIGFKVWLNMVMYGLSQLRQ